MWIYNDKSHVRRMIATTLFALVSLSSGVHAQTRDASLTAPPTVTLVPGQPVKAVWPSGNEAELKFHRSTYIKPTVGLQVTENACTGLTGDMVQMTVPLRIDRLVWIWSKHSDPAKVGSFVASQSPGGLEVLFEFKMITNGTRFAVPAIAADVPPDELQFASLKWLPGFTSQTLTPFTITSWQSENMVQNSQTGANENRVTGAAFGVHVRPTGPLSGVVESSDSGFALGALGPEQAYLGNVVTWSFAGPTGPCQIVFKFDIGNANTEVKNFITSLPNSFAPYLWRQDALIELVGESFVNQRLRYVEHQ